MESYRKKFKFLWYWFRMKPGIRFYRLPEGEWWGYIRTWVVNFNIYHQVPRPRAG